MGDVVGDDGCGRAQVVGDGADGDGGEAPFGGDPDDRVGHGGEAGGVVYLAGHGREPTLSCNGRCATLVA
nr:hypothetical protein GCM10017745_60930 [Saccharothrix mutabilis subsp. capreolus]